MITLQFNRTVETFCEEIFPMNQAMKALRASATPAPIPFLNSFNVPARLCPMTVGKRHARILLVLDKLKGKKVEAVLDEIADRFFKKYPVREIYSATAELRAMGGHVLEYEEMLYLSDSGEAFLEEIKGVRPAMLGVSTSPNIKPMSQSVN
jgi:hypothetical protein